MRVLVLFNATAGALLRGDSGDPGESLRRAFASAGVDADVRAVPGDELHDAARDAARGYSHGAIVAAGGDGTMSAVASALLGSDIPLGVVPVGTLNHFAKDLALPLTIQDAARVIAAGKTRLVDVGDVDGRCFVNNASIGLYPRAVIRRDREMQRLGLSKSRAMFRACLAVFRRFPTVRVRLTLAGGETVCDTPFVFVGNNRYEIDLMNLGRRTALDRGELCVYFTRRTGRLAMLTLAMRAMFGRLEQSRDFETLYPRELTIETPKHHIRVAADGEVVEMRPPLHFRVRPRALKVIVPGGNAEVGMRNAEPGRQ